MVSDNYAESPDRKKHYGYESIGPNNQKIEQSNNISNV